MDQLKELIQEIIVHIGGSATFAESAVFWVMLVISALVSGFIGMLCHRCATPIILHVVSKTQTTLDDYFFNRPVLRALWHVVPGILFFTSLPYCTTPHTTENALTFISSIASIYITITFILLFTTFLTNINNYTTEQERFRNHHLAGIIQFLKITIYFLGAIVIVAILLGRDPLGLVAGLGAAATVLMLVFKDTILGLVAGIQLSANRMLKTGDWVTIEKLGINGIVQKVSLTTVKIQNFDNTISTVPPYTLVSESFQNWEGMKERQARRVKRAIYIDVTSVRLCSADDIKALADKNLLAPCDTEPTAKAANLTLFRHYAEHYLKTLPHVLNAEPWQWVMARQLDPTPHGLPLEFWFYLSETRFVEFENLAGCYMEYLIAAAPQFGLRLFQQPTGSDLKSLLSAPQADN